MLGVSEFVRKLTERLTDLLPMSAILNMLFMWLRRAGLMSLLPQAYCAR